NTRKIIINLLLLLVPMSFLRKKIRYHLNHKFIPINKIDSLIETKIVSNINTYSNEYFIKENKNIYWGGA
uniref:hypothetical protein n=1 Tax=Campylobacter sp. TaxID=205 RepID=UPI0025C1A324